MVADKTNRTVWAVKKSEQNDSADDRTTDVSRHKHKGDYFFSRKFTVMTDHIYANLIHAPHPTRGEGEG
jgi:hypothetical protein